MSRHSPAPSLGLPGVGSIRTADLRRQITDRHEEAVETIVPRPPGAVVTAIVVT
jgi:hypothetical protein